MKSPLDISYQDLIDSTERHLKWMQVNYPGMVSSGRKNSYNATKEIEIEKQKLKLLKKFKRDPQLNLYDEFNRP